LNALQITALSFIHSFTICYRPSLCLSSVCLSVVCTNVRAPYTQAVEIFGNVSTTPFGTLAICEHTPSSTTLPANLMRTTHEYVHLVTRGHFRSRNKDGGHTIRSGIVENPMLHAKFMALFYRTGVIANRSFTLRE